MTNNFIGVRQLATQLGVSIPTIRRWVHDGSLPCLKLNGTTVRFAPEHIAAFIRAGQQKAATTA